MVKNESILFLFCGRWFFIALTIGAILLVDLGAAWARPATGVPIAIRPSNIGKKIQLVEDALAEAKLGHWPAAKQAARTSGSILLEKSLALEEHLQQSSNFEAIVKMIEHYRGWPGQDKLRRLAEDDLTVDIGNARFVRDWFKRYPPLTDGGWLKYLEAHFNYHLQPEINTDHRDDIIRQLWRRQDLSRSVERHLAKVYARVLTQIDHQDRFDILLFSKRWGRASDMISRIKPQRQALARARIALAKRSKGVDKAIAKVPLDQRLDEGLLLERLDWRMARGREEDTVQLLSQVRDKRRYGERWLVYKRYAMRYFLDQSHPQKAYDLMMNHGFGDDAARAKAEWLAGWIAASFLRQYSIAYSHFRTAFYTASDLEVKAKAAWWLAQVCGDVSFQTSESRLAKGQACQDYWYNQAAGSGYGFYALLSRRLTEFTPERAPLFINCNQFVSLPLLALDDPARLIRLYADAGLETKARRWLQSLFAIAKADRDDAKMGVLIQLARLYGWPSEAVQFSRARAGVLSLFPLYSAGWPTDYVAKAIKHQPLILAIIRNESSFRISAQSGAGARGLMQIMPATAKGMARSLGLPYSKRRLSRDQQYNLAIGTAYLYRMLLQYDGVWPLALAAYNAGPRWVRFWLEFYGNPWRQARESDIGRDGLGLTYRFNNRVDSNHRPAALNGWAMVDWIERIPFRETRRYIRKVLADTMIYQGLETCRLVP